MALLAAGAHVLAVEAHPGRARLLRTRFAPRTAVTVLQVDASDLRLPRRPFHVVSNPPFGIMTALLRRLVGPKSRLESAHLVAPRYVVRQWTSSSAPGWGRWKDRFAITTSVTVPNRAFSPRPTRDAKVLVIRRATK
jgi:23S rRNA (adenine-N6)-dimethyltransferase